ncbi:patatin-like phospholipase family protein [Alteromonas sp. C1M14]|uniref:patatin-like phospholipase family protein n=1 Tax=Alteromonas sp. C1M14 TaxID=2841567 RepID=UPI001C094400|nr:patatin-like phospholipase family protein [Alteromonas sp. C1M14]MBU2977751.1 patatin-like phospholipase family protein [Alteromonas sp. C1M14]
MSESSVYPKHIVPILAGGGTRLPAHIGILQALQDLHIECQHIVGVSGGSIIAALFAKGVTLDKMKSLALETDFRQFADFSLWRLLREGGLASGDRFEKWLDDLLEGVTFAALPIHLHILATDVNGGGPVLFDKETTPDLKVSAAVRASMSIPLVFAFRPYEDKLLVDGAILSEDALFRDWQQDGTLSVCFRLQSKQKKESLSKQRRFVLPLYLTLLARTFMSALSREYVHAEFWQRTILVDTGEVSAVDFNAGNDDKQVLFDTGYETTMRFLPAKLHRQLQQTH